MDVVFHGTRRKKIAAKPPDDSANVAVEIVAPIVGDPWGAILGRKHQMDEDVGQGLGHERMDRKMDWRDQTDNGIAGMQRSVRPVRAR